MDANIKRNTAREYLRVSLDSSGREKSPAEQHGDNKKAADSNGWRLGEPYKDIGSASRYAKKARAGFDQLISDLEKDRFGAGVLIMWESSRGSRRMSEVVRLVELCEERGVLIHITVDRKTYNPAMPRDRKDLLTDGIDAEHESAKTSGRAKRARAADAADGRPNGPANFGYQRVFDPATGKLDKQLRHPEEAPVIEELFDRLHKGHSLRSIALDFEARGIRSRQRYDSEGEPIERIAFSQQHLRSFALNRAYVGEREHEEGRRGRRRVGEVKYFPAMWPALVSREKFFAVQARLTDPARVTIRPGRAKHPLSLIAVCDVCDGPMAAKRVTAPNPIYICNNGGHVSVPYGELNDYVEAEILAYLSRKDNLARLAASDYAEVEQARATVAELQGELRQLAARVGRGELGQDFAAMVEPGIQARLKSAQATETRLSTPTALSGFVGPDGDVGAAWNGAPISARREVARLILVPHLLGEVRVIRSPLNRTRVPIEARVVWRQE